ncbi:F-box only protein 39-like [Anneissia japonica]|uniref:F-box only protein 39-like n=1 Tax=Anneissia japonica TaxID=1529436 RepID=UPI001425868B|nr:F-box only protein 39-like [Anneissia japonica]
MDIENIHIEAEVCSSESGNRILQVDRKVISSHEGASSSALYKMFDDDDETEDYFEPIPQWECLPHFIITDIANYLSDVHRISMALVCRSWFVCVMKAPRIWRDKTITLTGEKYDQNHLRYVRSVGRYLHSFHVFSHIRSYYNRYQVRRFQRILTTILAELYRKGPVQLKEVSFVDFFIHRHMRFDRDQVCRKGVLRSLRRFLRVQYRLESADLTGICIKFEEAIQLLSCLPTSSGKTLSNLYIHQLLQTHEEGYTQMSFVEAIGRFENLSVLHIDYNCISDDLLVTLSEHKRGILQEIVIKCRREDTHNHVVEEESWRKLHKSMPLLTVEMVCREIVRFSALKPILVSSMQLTSLEILGHDNSDNFQPDRLLRHIAKAFPMSLERLVVDVNQVRRTMSHGFLAIIMNCINIDYLEIHGRILVEYLQEMFDHFQVVVNKDRLAPGPMHFRYIGYGLDHIDGFAETAVMFEDYQNLVTQHNCTYEFLMDPYLATAWL